jgi:aspartate/methionine/tyrosine aminotransferase
MRPFALEAYFSEWNHRVRHDLTASDSETMGLADLLALADTDDLARWERLGLGYTSPRGAIWLREVIAERYEKVGPSDVMCFAGAQEGIFAAMHVLLGRDDHAIVVTPNYQSAESVPKSLCEVSGVALDEARGWTLDIDQVKSLVRPQTRLIFINFPNNPTGKILEPDRLSALIGLCRTHGIWLFSDEIYRGIACDERKVPPPVADAYELGLSLNGLSKAFGLPGLRIGWIACRDPALLHRMEEQRHYLSICNAAPSEVLARIALRAESHILGRNRRIARQNLALLRAFFAGRADLFAWHEPDGGVVAFPRYLGTEGVEIFVRRLIETAGVLLLPASVYRSELTATPEPHFRIGFGRAAFAQSLAALAAELPGPRPSGTERQNRP